MADVFSLYRFSSIPSFRSYPRSREGEALATNYLPSSPSPIPSSSASSHGPRRSARIFRCFPKDRDDGIIFGGDDVYGFYPWDPRNSSGGVEDIQWVPEDRVTLFTTEGLIQIGGSLIPRRASSSERKRGRSKALQKLRRFQESKYMDPNQGLCLGALFDIAATNGLDTGRRLCIFGFCRSIEMICDVVEDVVLDHGGEVVVAEKASEGGLNEKLTMIVAVPLLWGVPPASETLHFAVKSGGGIVEKVYWQWDFL